MGKRVDTLIVTDSIADKQSWPNSPFTGSEVVMSGWHVSKVPGTDFRVRQEIQRLANNGQFCTERAGIDV